MTDGEIVGIKSLASSKTIANASPMASAAVVLAVAWPGQAGKLPPHTHIEHDVTRQSQGRRRIAGLTIS